MIGLKKLEITFFSSDIKNEIQSDTKIILTYIKVEIRSKKKKKRNIFLINVYIKLF